MAVWEVAIEKTMGGLEYWLNVYHVNVGTLSEAQLAGLEIAACEQAISSNQVAFTKMRVKPTFSVAPGTVFPLNFAGTIGALPYLPLFVVQRVDFAVATGRPSRKYLRPPISNTSVVQGQFIAAHLTFIQDTYCAPIAGVEGLCDSQGNPFVSIGAIAAVGMRQLRRGSRKKATPIIP